MEGAAEQGGGQRGPGPTGSAGREAAPPDAGAALRLEQFRINQARLRPAWIASPPVMFAFWALDVAVVPDQKWFFLGIRAVLVALTGGCIVWGLATRSQRSFRLALVVASLLMGAVVPTMTFFMGGFGSLYTYFVPVALLGAGVMFAWPVRDGAAFLGLALAYYLAGNGILLLGGTGTWAEALGGALFVGALCTFCLLTMLFNERSLRAELRLRADLQQANQELLATIKALGEREGRLAAIGGVTSAIVHDVRNPLTAILSISQGVLDDATDAGQAELAEDMAAVVGSGQKLRGLFEQVQAFARAEGPPLEPERVGLAELVEPSLAGLATQLASQGISLERALGEAGATVVRADRAALRRVLEQLVRNAAQAIATRRAGGGPTGGRIRLEATRSGRRLLLRVSDDGCGLDPATRARLFHPFVEARPGSGHGLGLAVARSLVRAQGGELSAEPDAPPGGGATFTVELAVGPDSGSF